MSIEAEIAAQFAGSLEMEHELDKFAGEVRDYAKSLAPVFGDLPPKRDHPEEGDPGDYKNSITVEKVHGSMHTRRVISRDKKAVWIEIGTRHMPEYGVFTKTAAYFGATSGPSFSASGRDSMADHGVQHAQHHLREQLEHFAKLTATGAGAHALKTQRAKVNTARVARTAAFNAARPRRRGRR